MERKHWVELFHLQGFFLGGGRCVWVWLLEKLQVFWGKWIKSLETNWGLVTWLTDQTPVPRALGWEPMQRRSPGSEGLLESQIRSRNEVYGLTLQQVWQWDGVFSWSGYSVRNVPPRLDGSSTFNPSLKTQYSSGAHDRKRSDTASQRFLRGRWVRPERMWISS